MATATKKTPRYSTERIKAQVARRNRKLTKGLYKIECVAAAPNAPKEPEFNLSSKLVFALVNPDTNAVTNFKVNQYVAAWPLDNTDVKDHVPPEWADMATPMVQALFKTPLYPRRDPKTKQLMYDGEAIDAADEDTYKLAAEEEAMAAMDEAYDNHDLFIGKRCYAFLDPSPVNKKTGEVSDFPSLSKFQADLREGQAVVPFAQWFGGEAAPESVTEKASRFKSASAPAAKASGKVKIRK